jgi:hypothetical protein
MKHIALKHDRVLVFNRFFIKKLLIFTAYFILTSFESGKKKATLSFRFNPPYEAPPLSQEKTISGF